jgi:hypothetical protein
MRFQMSANVARQPFCIRDQEVEAELIVWQPNGEETSVDHGDDFEGHLGQSPGHVQIVQDTVNVAGFQEDQPAVVFGVVVGAIGDHRRYE